MRSSTVAAAVRSEMWSQRTQVDDDAVGCVLRDLPLPACC